MIRLEGYDIAEHLYESAHSLIYRAQRHSDKLPIILKILKGDYPSPETLARFRREYEITRSFELEGIIRVYGLEAYRHSLMMLVEDFGGESLSRLMSGQPPDLPAFLRLAIRITEILGQIHARNIIHKDMNPSNIIWNPETDQLKIIDFGISSQLSQEQPELQHPTVLEGTLAYMSPEQTGRMNRPMDYRSDLYSLGVTFYHLLTGQLPFQVDDAMELVYCHLAKMPVPPCDVVETHHRASL